MFLLSLIKTIYLISRLGFLANASMLARVVDADVNLSVAEPARVTRVTLTPKIVNLVDANAVAAQVGRTIVLVGLTARPGEARGAVAREAVEGVAAGAPVVAGTARTVVNVVLAVLAAEPVDAGAVVVTDAVRAVAVVLARVRAALVIVYLAVLAQKS